MPLLFSYINKETDPDNLWKIQRRVAKSLREANDDDRGLAETADMSEDTDDIIDKINKVVEQTLNITNTLLNERSKIKRPTDIINTPDFNYSNLDKFITDFNKIDVNKMNASNIQKLTDAKTELEAFNDLRDKYEEAKQEGDMTKARKIYDKAAHLHRYMEEKDQQKTKKAIVEMTNYLK